MGEQSIMAFYEKPPSFDGLETLGDSRAWAVFSPCGRYRYALGRTWWDDYSAKLVVIGLNPSTATHEVLDPTLRKIQKFARRDEFGGFVMLNCFGLRSTDPRGVRDALRAGEDAFGPENERIVRSVVAGVTLGKVVAAWGKPSFRLMQRYVAANGATIRALRSMWAWGVTRDGFPRHPLYLRDNSPLVTWPQIEE